MCSVKARTQIRNIQTKDIFAAVGAANLAGKDGDRARCGTVCIKFQVRDMGPAGEFLQAIPKRRLTVGQRRYGNDLK